MSKPTIILGLSFFYHDSAAALLVDGTVLAAAQEERFSRKKHDAGFPSLAIDFCLKEAGIGIDQVDHVVFYEKPIRKFERLLQTYIHSWPKGILSFIPAMEALLKEKLWVQKIVKKKTGYKGSVLYAEHHYAHAASAYYCSPFQDAAVVTMDGVGEWDTTTIGFGKDNHLTLTESIHFPHSLGLLYSALTYYLGFKVNSAEYKVMGLAPYGDPARYRDAFKKLITLAPDGSFALDMSYFAYEYGLRMTNRKFNALFCAPPRKPSDPLTQREKDIAAALQEVTEEAVLGIVRHAKEKHPSENLCLSGGVALNCVANGKILNKKLFKNIYVQPAAGDAGGALGAALYMYYEVLGNEKKTAAMDHAFLGSQYGNGEIERFLTTEAPTLFGGKKIAYRKLSDEELISTTASLIRGNNVIGWFEGRMEFGPRALGARSIIADPRNKENWQKVNLKIKYRESFRPFAPAVLLEESKNYFDLDCESPYMLLVAHVKRDDIPAVTHVDRSARVQTITREQNKRFYDLIAEFFKQTDCPVIINTSFNVRGEPIVERPLDAVRCFLNTEMDHLVMGNYILSKADNMALVDTKNKEKYLAGFELD